MAFNGDKYALTVTDFAKAQAFFTTRAACLDTTNNSWLSSTDIGKVFNDAYDFYKTRVYKNDPNKNNLSYEMTMGAVLNQFDVGITLNKQDANGNFKRLRTQENIVNGNTTYTANNCP